MFFCGKPPQCSRGSLPQSQTFEIANSVFLRSLCLALHWYGSRNAILIVRKKRSNQVKRTICAAVFLHAVLLLNAVPSLSMFTDHFSINTTTSMPRGIYRITKAPLKRGAIVGACLPIQYAAFAIERGYLSSGRCSSGVRPILKYAAAVPGDSICIRKAGISVNGKAIPNTNVFAVDGLGRTLPNHIGAYTTRAGEYWLVSAHDPGSFDSRYFGPVTEILGVAKPVITEAHLCRLAFLQQFLRC